MFETAGSLASIQSVVALVGLVALPLLWALWGWMAAASDDARTPGGGLVGTIVALTAAAGTFCLAVVLSARLALAPAGTVLVQHVSQLGRLGQLDLAFDLAFDRRTAAFVIVVALLSCASSLNTAWSPRPGTATRLAWTGLATSGSLLFTIGDGFAPIFVGLGLLSVAAWGLSRGGAPIPNATALAGNVGVLLGLVFLFWSLGGAFGPEGYDPDGAPRFVLVSSPLAGGDPARATLSMTTHAGALVSSDDADLPGEPIVSPFSISVPPGIHTLRVQGGAASADVVVPRVALVAGSAHVLTPYGPTASLRVLDDQFAVPRLGPGRTPASVRATLAGRTIGGLRASAIVLLLVLGGALAHVHALASRRGHSAIAILLESLPAPWLALRLAPLVEPSAADGALVVLLGAGSAFVLAARAAATDDGHQALRGVLAAAASVAVASVGLGEASGALVLACASLVATAGALAAIDARRDVRWLGVACAASVGLLPGAGASTGYMLAVNAAFGAAASGGPARAVFAAAVAGAIILACGLAALAAFRVYDALIRAAVRDPGTSRGQGAVVVFLAVVALVGGAVLGAGTTMFGGAEVPLARRLAGPAGPVIPKVMAVASAILPVIAAAVGVVIARRVSVDVASPPWLVALSRPYAMLGWTAHAVSDAAIYLHRSVWTTDREIIEDIPLALRELASRVRPPRKPAPPEARGSTRLRSVALLVMVALLGSVVFSSLVLR